ncbi:Hypothetical protein A7982_05722 [Minicystis rosea]|nr:Hypothetical protein A7982_05722 [Minicystis rosea]
MRATLARDAAQGRACVLSTTRAAHGPHSIRAPSERVGSLRSWASLCSKWARSLRCLVDLPVREGPRRSGRDGTDRGGRSLALGSAARSRRGHAGDGAGEARHRGSSSGRAPARMSRAMARLVQRLLLRDATRVDVLRCTR